MARRSVDSGSVYVAQVQAAVEREGFARRRLGAVTPVAEREEVVAQAAVERDGCVRRRTGGEVESTPVADRDELAAGQYVRHKSMPGGPVSTERRASSVLL